MTYFSPWLMGAAIAGCLAFSGSAWAATSIKNDPMVEGAMMCTKHFPRYEREYGIPTHLLSAIASTESGRYHKGLKIKLPWPWTVTSGGAGKFYDTKAEAIAAVKKLKAQGVKNIDVGCMQVNLYHHADAFASVEQAFEPEYNINYAATFLRRLYNEEHSWKQAASNYHSKTPSHGARYIGVVYDSWFNIIQKLREARLAVPSSSVAAMNELKGAKPQQYASAKIEPYPAGAVAAKPAYNPPRMNSIKVTKLDDSSSPATPESISYTRKERSNGPIVVREGGKPVNASGLNNGGALVITPAQPSASAPQPANNSYAVATVNTSPAPLPTASAGVANNGAQANVSVSVPLSGVTQAAIAPVTGLANAVLREATSQVAEGMQGVVSAPEPVSSARPLQASLSTYHTGPTFIFSE